MSNIDAKIKSVVLRLILEYETYENWQKCVSISFTNRINWLWEFVENFDCSDIYELLKIQPQDSCHQINVRLIKLMELMHRVEDLPEDDDFESITPFEEILELTDQMLNLCFKEPIKASLLKVKKAAQQESVMECLRQRKMSLAKSVFERVWANTPLSLKSTKSQLSSMIKNEAEISNIPPSTFNDSFKQFLSKHFSSLPTPFLTTFADNLIKASPSSFGVYSKKKKLACDISSCKHMLVKCWLSNYFCHLAFANVQKLHLSDYSWILKFISENSLDFKSSLLIRFLFKYNEHLTSNQMQFFSPLELSLSLIEEIDKKYPETQDSILELLDAMKYQLKKAAVLGWCLENNYENARKVFEKLVSKDGEEEEALSTDLEGYLRGEKPLNSYAKADLYSAVEEYMEASFKRDPPIFLLATAKKIMENIERLAKEQNLEVHEEVDGDEKVENTQEVPGENGQVGKEGEDSKDVINGYEDKVNTPTSASIHSLSTSISSVTTTSTATTTTATSTATTTTNTTTTTKTTTTESASTTTTTTTAAATSASKMKKKVWLEEEEELIYKGTKIFGMGNWSTIARKLLIGRTNTDVKDKWRTMLKQGKVKKLERRDMVGSAAADAGGGGDADSVCTETALDDSFKAPSEPIVEQSSDDLAVEHDDHVHNDTS